MSPLELPATNTFLSLFPSKWTVSKYFLKSFIENGDLRFICSFFFFPMRLSNCRLRVSFEAAFTTFPPPLYPGKQPLFFLANLSWVRLKHRPPPLPPIPIRHTSPLLLVSGFLWVCKQTHFIKTFFQGTIKLPFPLVTRKWPQQLWRELVKLLQPTRPESETTPSLVPRSQAFPGALGLLKPCG